MKLNVTAPGVFEVGSKVGLHHRMGDYAGPAGAHLGDAIAAATVKDDGSVQFNAKAIVAGGRYWVGGRDVHGRFRSVQVTAPNPDEEPGTFDPQQEVPADVQAQLRDQMRPAGDTITVEGARSTASARPRRAKAPEQHPVVAASSLPELHEPSKRPDATQQHSQADAEGPQRSATPIGTAEEIPGKPLEESQPPVTAESAAAREERERLEAEAKRAKRRRKSRPPKNRGTTKAKGGKGARARLSAAQRKAQRSRAAKKAAATRKRNAAKKAGGS